MHRAQAPSRVALALLSIAGLVACSEQNHPASQETATPPQPEVVKMEKYQGPQDTPERRSRRDADRVLAPHIAAARQTLPGVKQRFLAGLPRGSTLFVTIALQDARNKENAYVTVERWSGAQISGIMATELRTVRRYRMGEPLVVSEQDVIDWTITSATGKEEGNFIGKFIDSQKQ